MSGLTPQIVTETIYVLACRSEDAYVPTEVHLLTTGEGAERARLRLLSQSPGWFHRLCEDYQLEGVQFDESNIHPVLDENHQPIDDIRTAEDNRRVADAVISWIRLFTADQDSALHVSLAGGRKTMSFFAGYALSLFARPQDRMSHVLVEPDFEFADEFFYPAPRQRIIQSRSGKPVDAAGARVELAEIPFVSLRHGLPERLYEEATSYGDVVREAQAALGPPLLVIDQPRRKISAAGKIIDMSPSALALLSVFARRAQCGQPPIAAPAKPVDKLVQPDAKWAEWFSKELLEMYQHEDDIPEPTRLALKHGMDGDYFSVQLSRLHRDLRRSLGAAAESYLIDNGGTRPCQYRLRLPPDAIRFESVGEVRN